MNCDLPARRRPAAVVIGTVMVLWMVGCGVCAAQFRADQQPVIAPPPAPEPARPVDVAPRFADAYRRGGEPKLVLLWNREFTDRTHATTVDRKVTRETARASTSGMDRTTQGAADSATLRESDDSSDRTKTVTTTREYADEPARKAAFAERHSIVLQRAFLGEMARGGARFIDRALVMRTTAAAQHRAGGDPKLVETDALLAHADLLLEVLIVDDKDAPAGHGFDVRVKSLRTGEELTTLYSRAVPAAAPRPPGRWVAGENGYEFRLPPAPPPPSPVEIGAALARDVMVALGGNLSSAPAAQGKAK